MTFFEDEFDKMNVIFFRMSSLSRKNTDCRANHMPSTYVYIPRPEIPPPLQFLRRFDFFCYMSTWHVPKEN